VIEVDYDDLMNEINLSEDLETINERWFVRNG
jgi:hypothetical protein